MHINSIKYLFVNVELHVLVSVNDAKFLSFFNSGGRQRQHLSARRGRGQQEGGKGQCRMVRLAGAGIRQQRSSQSVIEIRALYLEEGNEKQRPRFQIS